MHNFESAFKEFMETLQGHFNKHHANSCKANQTIITAEEGKKYIRIVTNRNEGASKSAYCFINKETGDILKCDTYRKPAKHSRGSIYSVNHGMECCGPYGVQYMERSGYQTQTFA